MVSQEDCTLAVDSTLQHLAACVLIARPLTSSQSQQRSTTMQCKGRWHSRTFFFAQYALEVIHILCADSSRVNTPGATKMSNEPFLAQSEEPNNSLHSSWRSSLMRARSTWVRPNNRGRAPSRGIFFGICTHKTGWANALASSRSLFRSTVLSSGLYAASSGRTADTPPGVLARALKVCSNTM